MNCNYCTSANARPTHHYSIANVRGRTIPTYNHTQIFAPQQPTTVQVRCTPTFHSTALNAEGYTQKVRQRRLTAEAVEREKFVYLNESREKRLEQLNPNSYKGQFRAETWYDPAKQELFNSLKCSSARYSRERKLADLSSNPVFGGVVMQPFSQCNSPGTSLNPHQLAPTACTDQQPQRTHQEEVAQIPLIEARHSPKPESTADHPTVPVQPDEPRVTSCKSRQSEKRPQTSQKRTKGSQKYTLGSSVGLCGRGCSAGRKVARMVTLHPEPAYKVFRRG